MGWAILWAIFSKTHLVTLAFFSKKNLMITFKKTSRSFSKKCQFFQNLHIGRIFLRKYFSKTLTSVPGFEGEQRGPGVLPEQAENLVRPILQNRPRRPIQSDRG
jgi:hypothetical protein